jgi:hypothetical protein
MSRWNQKRIKVSLMVKVVNQSRYWGLAKYYSKMTTVEVKEKVIEAMNAYWFPLALSHGRGLDSKALNAAKYCCHRLQQRADEIMSEFSVCSQAKQIEYVGDGKEGEGEAAFTFFHYPYLNSDQGLLMQYLTDVNDVMSIEHKILSASDGFWTPLACKELGFSKRQMEVYVYWSLESLNKQIAFLKDYFQLERVATVNPTEMTSPVAPNISPTPTPEPEDPNRMTEEQMWNDPLMDEWGLNAFPDSFMDFDSNDSDK